MATFGGFAPGSYNAWALNLITDVFCTPGVARGMQVTAPGGMAVSLGVDPVALDGVVVMPNGGWLRIDQAITYTVPANGGSSTRTDAIVAFLDPTGVANPEFSITYNSNWAGGFTGGTVNQQVIALVSVAVGAVSIAAGNITMNPTTSHFGNPSQLVANDGIPLQVTDSSATSQMLLQPVISTPNYRAIVLTAVDSASGTHSFVFDQNSNLTIGGQHVFGPAVSGSPASLSYSPGNFGIQLATPQAGANTLGLYFPTWNGSAEKVPFSIGGQFGGATSWVDNTGSFSYGGGIGGFYSRVAWDGINHINTFWTPQNNVQNGMVFVTWTGGGQNNTLGIGVSGGAAAWVDQSGNYNGPIGGGIPTTRNGAALSVPIFTGTTTPVNPPTGSIWIKA